MSGLERNAELAIARITIATAELAALEAEVAADTAQHARQLAATASAEERQIAAAIMSRSGRSLQRLNYRIPSVRP